MVVIQNEFYDGDGTLNSNVSDALEKGIQDLVTNVLAEIPLPQDQPFVSQMLVRHIAASRLDLAFALAFVEASIAAGQGATRPTIHDPLKALEDTIDKAFEKAENGGWDGSSAHDMLQTFSRMLAYAKKGKAYFDDDDE